MPYRFLFTILKFLLISLLIGVALASFNITAVQVLKDFGLTPDQILSYARRGFNWALPHIIMGALITIPIWLVMYLFRPPPDD